MTSQCCARHCISVEPDFAAQKEWLREVIEEKGHKILFLPKYHCELNYIENVWGYMKAYLRRSCEYNFDTLEDKVIYFVYI
jgi:transposase